MAASSVPSSVPLVVTAGCGNGPVLDLILRSHGAAHDRAMELRQSNVAPLHLGPSGVAIPWAWAGSSQARRRND
nr:unnamed protein product [Digitaria exilis]